MPFIFQPLTGDLVLVPASSGGGAVDSVNGMTGTVVLTTTNISEGSNLYFTNARAISATANYSSSFNNTTDWTLSSGNYIITINQVAHLKGVNPQVQVFELITGIYYLVNIETRIDSSGNITIVVPSSPDNRFAGKLEIS